MSSEIGPKTIRDGLVFAVDAADFGSYPQSGTTWFDLSPNSRNATLTGSLSFSSSYGGGLQFNGTNTQAIISNFPSVTSSAGMTFNIWMEQTTTGSGSNPRVFSKYESTSSGYQFGSPGIDITKFTFRLDVGAGSGSCVTSGIPVIGQIYNLVIVYSGNNPLPVLSIYTNGVLNSISGALGSLGISVPSGNQSTTLYLGSSPTSNFVNGKIYAFHVYDRAFTDWEAKNLYNSFKPRFGLS